MKRISVFFMFVLTGCVLLSLTNMSEVNAQNMKKMTPKNEKHSVYYTQLSGKSMVPPVMTKASGHAKFTFSKDGKSLHYVVYVAHIDSVFMIHIHHAPKGKNGPIAVWLFKSKPTNVSGGVIAQGNITNKEINLDTLRTWMEEGNTFVMVHTKANPAGEIRGQIYPYSKKAMKAE